VSNGFLVKPGRIPEAPSARVTFWTLPLQTQAASAQPAQHRRAQTTSYTDTIPKQNKFWQKQPQKLLVVNSQDEVLLRKVKYLSKLYNVLVKAQGAPHLF